MRQKTINNSATCEGVGIHTGERVALTINPAPANHGIVFIRTDLTSHYRIPAIWENIKSALNASTLGVNGTRISTVEHLLAALAAQGIDNASVEVDGPEVPILDGSAGPFVEMIKRAGVVELDPPRSWVVIRKPVRVRMNGSFAEIHPSKAPSISCSIAYDHPSLQYQERTARLSCAEFESEIANARTYGFLKDVDRLRAMGLAKGGSLENAVIFDDSGVVNEEGMRWEDECVRHKILDLFGDLFLFGRPVLGEVKAHKPGHALNHMLIREVLTNPDCYEIVSDPSDLAGMLTPEVMEEHGIRA
ncbi:MAG TPA: UDP-3-O-acyl-N-acetylglucosamine deacetylase [bacterium]|nr:UDP-3-O-acyl-N-acetylglucosamine deacetylase [bacterium]